MASDILYAAIYWVETPSEAYRRDIEALAKIAARGADPLGVAAAEEAAEMENWAQAKANFEYAYAVYTASKSEEDRQVARWALQTQEAANRYLRAAMIAREFISAAVLAA